MLCFLVVNKIESLKGLCAFLMLSPPRLPPPHTYLHTNSLKTTWEFRCIPPKWLWSQAHSQCGPQTRYVSWKSFRNAVSGLQTRFPTWFLCILNIQKHCFKEVGCFVCLRIGITWEAWKTDGPITRNSELIGLRCSGILTLRNVFLSVVFLCYEIGIMTPAPTTA